MTLKELTIKRGLRAEATLRYLQIRLSKTEPFLVDQHVKSMIDRALNDIADMIFEFEESNGVHKDDAD